MSGTVDPDDHIVVVVAGSTGVIPSGSSVPSVVFSPEVGIGDNTREARDQAIQAAEAAQLAYEEVQDVADAARAAAWSRVNVLTDMPGAEVPDTVDAAWAGGHTTPGDGGTGALLTRLPAAPITPMTNIHYQLADGSYMELSNGADGTTAAMAGVLGNAVGTNPGGSQNDAPGLQALSNHLFSKYGAGNVIMGWRRYSLQTIWAPPNRVGIRGAVKPSVDKIDGSFLNNPAILHPGNMLVIGRDCRVEDLMVLNTSYVEPSSWADMMNTAAAFLGSGLRLVKTGGPSNQPENVHLLNVHSYGFNKCFEFGKANRLLAEKCWADGNNGFYCNNGVGDGMRFILCRQFNFLGVATEARSNTVKIIDYFNSGGKLAANVDEDISNLLTGQRVGTDDLPVQGMGRATVDRLSATAVRFRDIDYGSIDPIDLDPQGANISYQPNGSSVITALSNDGGLTRITTEVPFPFLAVGHPVHIGVDDVDSAMQDLHTIVAVHSPTQFTVDQPWEAGFAAVNLVNSDFVLMPQVRPGYGFYVDGPDGLYMQRCGVKGPMYAYRVKAALAHIDGCGSEGGVIGELGFAPKGTIGFHLAGGARVTLQGCSFKTADIGFIGEGSSSTATVITAMQAQGNQAAMDLRKGHYVFVGYRRPPGTIDKARVFVKNAVRHTISLVGELPRSFFIPEGPQAAKRIFVYPDNDDAIADTHRFAAPKLLFQALKAADGATIDRLKIEEAGTTIYGPATINNVSMPFGLQAATTDATPTRLTMDGATATAANVGTLVDNAFGKRAYTLRITVTAQRTGGAGSAGDGASWVRDVLMTRDLGANSTTLQNGDPALSPSFSKGGGSAYRLSITADTTLGAVNITGTGIASSDVSWKATIQVI